MESGNDSKRLEEALSSSRFSSPAIESGMAYSSTQRVVSMESVQLS